MPTNPLVDIKKGDYVIVVDGHNLAPWLKKYIGNIRKVIHANEYDSYFILDGIPGASGNFFFRNELMKIDINTMSELEKLLHDVD